MQVRAKPQCETKKEEMYARLYVKIKDQDNVVVAVQDLKAGHRDHGRSCDQSGHSAGS